jgi:hypothetical protein
MTHSMDVAHFNRVANDPSVRPWLGGTGPLEFAPIIGDPSNFAFASEHGGILAVALGSGRYDIHTLFLEEGRGLEALETARDVADFLFGRTDCVEARTTVPLLNRAGLGLAKRIGFELRFESALPWHDGDTVPAGFYTLTLERWALTAPSARHAGAEFHQALEAEKHRLGSTLPGHPDDEVHDRIAGSAVIMTRGGQVEKAVRFYNVWAQVTRYDTIALLRVYPPILDVQGFTMSMTAGGELVMLRCGEGREVCPSASVS